MATVDRAAEVNRFLNALQAQTHRAFELIVVDQNADDRVGRLLQTHERNFPITHVRRPDRRGVSWARNLGLQHISGEIVTFPDDDCWYPPNLLESVDQFMASHSDIDSLSGRMEINGEQQYPHIPEDHQHGSFLTQPIKIIQVPGPWSLFLRAQVAKTVGNYDETLGPGANTSWGAGEDTDYYLRVVKSGFNLYSHPGIVVRHPSATPYYADMIDLNRSYRYGMGRAKVWKRHQLPVWYFVYEICRSLTGVMLSLLRFQIPKAHWHWGAFRGKFSGWFSAD